MQNEDQINKRVEELATELRTAIASHADSIRPHEAALVAEAGLAYAALSHDLAGLAYFTGLSAALVEDAAWIESLSHPALANIFLNLPLTTDADPDGPLDKRLALEVAEAIGPDHAQKLYRFAVLVTKIA